MSTTSAESSIQTPGNRISRPGEPTWEIALLYPEQGAWTEEEYLALDDKTNWMIELSNGCLEVLAMPTVFHQLMVKYLVHVLDRFLADRALAGQTLFAPLPVRLGPAWHREPDIVYLKPERLNDLYRGRPKGADLVMEIVSPDSDSRKRDLLVKREEYAAAGIPEYWIVDPDEKRVTVLTLDGKVYREHGIFAPGAQASSAALPGFTVDVSAVFAAGHGG